MFTQIDRHLIKNYVKAYAVCLVSMMGLFVVVDLFTNLDKFTQHNRALSELIGHIGLFYLNKLPQIFNHLCEAICLLAGMFTVAWMQRNNELLPLLSAGVSTRRVVRPVLLSACLVMGLCVINQEILLPLIDNYLLENAGDPDGKTELSVNGAFDANGVLFMGQRAVRKDKLVRDFYVTFPPRLGRDTLVNLSAKEARYVPEGQGPRSGGWMLSGATPETIEAGIAPEILDNFAPGRYFLKTDVDFEKVTRQRNWWLCLSTWALYRDLGKTDVSRMAGLAVIFHTRLTRPFLGMILVILGLSVILRDQNRNVFLSAGLCLVLCALFFFACFFCKYLGEYEHLSPAFAAWLPVIVFGPLAFVMFDAVHT
jgi:lipopolysaccharide export system permease protein